MPNHTCLWDLSAVGRGKFNHVVVTGSCDFHIAFLFKFSNHRGRAQRRGFFKSSIPIAPDSYRERVDDRCQGNFATSSNFQIKYCVLNVPFLRGRAQRRGLLKYKNKYKKPFPLRVLPLKREDHWTMKFVVIRTLD